MAVDLKKIGLIVLAVIVLGVALLILAFIFLLPTWFDDGGMSQSIEPSLMEVVLRIGMVAGIVIIGFVIVGGLAFVVWEYFFKKKELHIVKEHQSIIKESAMLNPVPTMGNLVMTGKQGIQHYELGKIVGHTQVPVKFERMVIFDESGQETPMSESQKSFDVRRDDAIEDGRDRYDFFAIVSRRGLYALPIFNLLEPVKIFACYPAERSKDLLGDVEIYDIGSWKYGNVFVPAQRAKEPMVSISEFKSQLMPIAYMSLLDYLGLVAQRGIEGDTSMQKWLQAKSSQVNIKE